MSIQRRSAHARQLVHDTAILTIGNVVALAVGLVGTVLVTRALAPDGRGVYAWLLTLAGLAGHLATLAPANAVRAVTNGRDGRVAATLATLCLLGSVLTLPLAVYAWLDPTLGPLARPLIPLLWASVPAAAMSVALGTLVQVDGRPGQILAIAAGPRLVQTLAFAALMPLGLIDLSVSVWVYVVAAWASLALTLAFLKQPARDFVPSLALMRSFAGLLGAGWVASLAAFCLPTASLLVLGSAAPAAVTGQYSVALTFQQAMTLLPAAVGSVLISHVRRHGLPRVRDQARAAGIAFAAMAAVCLVSGLTAPSVMPLLFGPAYAPAAPLYGELLLGVMLATVYYLCQPVLFARRQAMDIALPSAAGLGVATVAALVAVPRLGPEGAVLGNVLGYAVLAAFAVWSVLRPGTQAAPAREAVAG